MSTTTPHPSGHPYAGAGLRLFLTPDGPSPRLDGAWWPRSRDLSTELPLLVAALDRTWGAVTRATVHAPGWSKLRHRIPAGCHGVRVNWYDPAQGADAIDLFSERAGARELLVVPPETAPGRAARLMSAASRAGNRDSGPSLLSGGPPPPNTPPRDRIRIRTWRSEEAGGPDSRHDVVES
jgi:hypothetical protein